MRFLLLLALLLYNIVVNASRAISYDYPDTETIKRHASLDERRNYRKGALMKNMDHDREWDRIFDHERPKYAEEGQRASAVMDRHREMEVSMPYERRRHYDERDKNNAPRPKSAEMFNSFQEKVEEKKALSSLGCERPHERYEACFAGCAAITCDNPRERLRPCYPFCEAGCICEHPYVRDDRTHKCVLPDDCTKGLKGIPDITEDI